jgi:transposase-like protein
VSSLIVNRRLHQNNSCCQRKLMPRLSQNEKEQAVRMLVAGMTQTQFANHFNLSRMTIYRLMIRLRDTGNTLDRPRSGRPRVATLCNRKRHTVNETPIFNNNMCVNFLFPFNLYAKREQIYI